MAADEDVSGLISLLTSPTMMSDERAGQGRVERARSADLGADLNALGLSSVVSHARNELDGCMREMSSWQRQPCADDGQVELVLCRLIASQRELLAWASKERRARIDAWVDGPIAERCALLKWQLRKFLNPQCALCTAGECAEHAQGLERRLPPLPSQMRAVTSDEVGERLRFWHSRSLEQLTFEGCLEVLAVLASADDWARPLRGDAAAEAVVRLARRADLNVEGLAGALHNRLFPACMAPWPHCAEHRARWQQREPPPIPPAPPVSPAHHGLVAAPGYGVTMSPHRTMQPGVRAQSQAPLPPPPPMHGCADDAACSP